MSNSDIIAQAATALTLFFVIYPVSVMIHELGHILVGILYGWRVTHLTLGGNFLAQSWMSDGIRYHVGLPLLGGNCKIAPKQPPPFQKENEYWINFAKRNREEIHIWLGGSALCSSLIIVMWIVVIIINTGTPLWTQLLFICLLLNDSTQITSSRSADRKRIKLLLEKRKNILARH